MMMAANIHNAFDHDLEIPLNAANARATPTAKTNI